MREKSLRQIERGERERERELLRERERERGGEGDIAEIDRKGGREKTAER